MQRTEWTNWAGNQRCLCNLYRPSSLGELQDAVGEAATRGRVRAAGTGYSWTPLVPTEDSVIECTNLNGLLGIRHDTSGPVPRHFVEVEAGLRMEELINITHSNGFTLRSPTLFPWPSIAGAVGTGAHGVGLEFGSFSDNVETVKVVQPDGTLRTVRAGDPEMRAARVALGALGVYYSVELEVVPEFNVYVDKRNVSVERTLAEFDDLVASYEFVEMFWMPGAKDFYFYLMDRTEAQADPWSWERKLKEAFDTQFQKRASNVWVPWIAKHAPGLTPVLTKLAGSSITQVEKEIQPASEAFHFQKAYAKNWDIAYSVPKEHASDAWRAAIELHAEYARVGRHPINFAFHGRFVGKSQSYLAPNHDRDSLFIEVATAVGTPGFQEFFDALEERWVDIPGARPHWGKHFRRYERLPTLYPKLPDFLAVREAWDPGRVFLNPWLEDDVFALP